jgi:C1A family cysteine protease
MEDLKSQQMRAEEDGHSLGLVPPPVDLPNVTSKSALAGRALVGLPSTYDLRTLDKLTSVKDQGSCGSCWAFAAYGSLESCLKPDEVWDFSENHLKNTANFDLDCCEGGNEYMATAYLARWSGPITEADDPYNAGSCTSPSGLTPAKHVQAVDFIPDRTGPLDNEAIKQAVMTYGAAYTSMYWSSACYNSATCSYYYSGTIYANHAVCIVGWDDNYDRTRFVSLPPGNGAFLIKNSWGTSFGLAGYFYVSYYDSDIGIENAVFRVPGPTNNYAHIYQYDPLGWVQSVGYGSETAWCANVFTASTGEELAAVSLYTAVPNSGYELRVYLDPTSGPLNASGPAVTQTGSIANAGYQTVQLNSSVSVSQGQRYSVVVMLTTPGYTYPIPMESPSFGYSGGATANAGESYISSNDTSWTDLTSSFANSNVCLKAFTMDTIGLLVTPTTGINSAGPVGGPFTPSSQDYTLRNTSSEPLSWTAVKNESWVSLSATGGTLATDETVLVTASINSNASSLPDGAYGDAIAFNNVTDGAGSTSRAVNLTVKDASLAVTPTTAFSSAGEVGGPFSPPSRIYTLTNTGYGTMIWTITKSQPWLDVSAGSGSIPPGGSTNVTASINSSAAALSIGDYLDAIWFTNTTNGSGNTSRNVTLSVTRNYDMSPTAFNWVDPSGHATFVLSDEGVSAAQTIPFNFSFYGMAYTQLYIGANGLLGFANTGLGEYLNRDIPSVNTPNAAIYPYWDDLNPSVGGTVHMGTVGAYPERKLVISWVGVPHYGSTNPLTFQVLLCETTGDVICQYLNVQPSDLIYGAGRSATIGVENATGAVARKYSYNGSSLLSNNQAILFTVNHGLTIAEAKRMANGILCTIRDALVTATPSVSQFYVQSDDRSAGMAIYKSSHGLSPGVRVDVVGTTATSSGGEKFINSTTVAANGPGGETLEPLMMANREVGGGDWFYDSGTKTGQQGVKDGTKDGPEECVFLNNIGLLIRTTGKVTYSTSGYFYVDDGAAAKDNSSYKGVKVLGTVPVQQGVDPVGKYVIVTGVSSTFKAASPSTDLYRQVRATEIVIVN